MRVHLLDLNAGEPNRGTAALAALAAPWGEARVHEVRRGLERPPTEDGVWILGGGPGTPWEDGPWRAPLLEALGARVRARLPTLAICYGFELLCLVTGSRISRLERPRLGVWPVALTAEGHADPLLRGLDGCGSFENRSWGVWGDPDWPAVALARGSEGDVTAARWSPEVVGTIFHPEADDAAKELLGTGALGGRVDQLYGVGTAERMSGLELGAVHRRVVSGFLTATLGARS